MGVSGDDGGGMRGELGSGVSGDTDRSRTGAARLTWGDSHNKERA
jgi:hypothetical protein